MESEGKRKDSIVIVVSPLNALIRDQLQKLKGCVNAAGIFCRSHSTGHSIFAPKQHKKSLNSANRTRQVLMYIFSKNMFRLSAQLL